MDTVPFDFARTNYVLAPHTRYHIGGSAHLALFPPTLADMEAAYQWLFTTDMPFIVIGGGANMLIDDRGYDGCALFTTELKEVHPLGNHSFFVGTGILLADLVRKIMLPNNYEGVGALTGIPGTVGGALFMNAGTANGSVCELAVSVDLLEDKGVRRLPLTPDRYGYRGQSFCQGDTVITGAMFRFTPSERDESEVYHHYMRRRSETQPDGLCCGSVFKNPPDDHAGRLIEAAGLKGKRHNGAIISEKHANFIMNDADASFDDVFHLITLVKQTVHARFGVELHEELRIIRSVP
ncbi:MAG: UDP-N-acetylmuramate dehydrogenase [Candidatus Hydrogenedentes bacterium]|nr:UDP-N-acetylmuramate dehydrogenase [Candidatus Hydrogenedentota bacterium]